MVTGLQTTPDLLPSSFPIKMLGYHRGFLRTKEVDLYQFPSPLPPCCFFPQENHGGGVIWAAVRGERWGSPAQWTKILSFYRNFQ